MCAQIHGPAPEPAAAPRLQEVYISIYTVQYVCMYVQMSPQNWWPTEPAFYLGI